MHSLTQFFFSYYVLRYLREWTGDIGYQESVNIQIQSYQLDRKRVDIFFEIVNYR